MTKTRAFFILLLLLPLIPLANFFTLGGVAQPPPHVPLTFATVASGSWQTWFEANFARHFGAFRPLVRLDAAFEQLIGESKFNSGFCALRGRNDVLIPSDEIEFMHRTDFDEDAITAHVESLAQALEKFKKLGIATHVFFIPTKLSNFEDPVPPRYRIDRPGTPAASEAVVERTLAKMRARNIPFTDVRGIIKRVIDETHRPAFPAGGRHFTDFTSCQLLGALQPKPVTCPVGDERPARGAEDDLRRCFNEVNWRGPERVIDTNLFEMPSTYRRVLFVGSSFMRELENESRRLHVFEDLHLFYYNENDYVGDWTAPIPKGESWRQFVKSRDLVVIDVFAGQVEKLGYGFTEHVVNEL